MDNIKLFAKNEKELETLIQAVRIYYQDKGMAFGIEKLAKLIMKRGKRQWQKEWLYYLEKIRTLGEKDTYKNLGILEADTIKQAEMKE